MKRIKRTLVLFAALASLLASLAAPAAAYMDAPDSGRGFVLDCDDYFLVPYHFNSVEGGYILDEQSYFLSRLQAFSRAYDCDVYFGCVSSPGQMWFDSFDAYRADFLSRCPGALGDNAVCVLYDQESGASQVHVGPDVAADCDTAPVAEALLDPDAENNYWRMVHVLDALQAAIARPGTCLLYCAQPEYYDQVQKNLEPLRKKFQGLVYAIYESTGLEGEYEHRADDYASLYTVCRMDSFLADAVCIFFYRNTGDVFIAVGDQTGLHVGSMDAVENAFTSTPGPMSTAGFDRGVEALARNLLAGQEVPNYVALSLLGTAAAVLALAAVIEAIARRRGRPLAPER